MSQYLDKDGASRIAENFLSKQAEQDAILQNLQFDLKEAEHALVKTIQGPAPLNIRALTRPLDDYLISGNTLQDGTPTSSDPVDVVGCGERTENLVDPSTIILNHNISSLGRVESDANYDVGCFQIIQGNTYTIDSYVYAFYYTIPTMGSVAYDRQRVVGTLGIPSSFTAPITGYCCFRVDHGDSFMANAGSTALPYEPYGYKLPLTIGGTEYPIYLGEVPTTRNIKKLVLTGEENCYTYVFQNTNGAYLLNALDATYFRDSGFCSHYPVSTAAELNTIWIGVNNKNLYFIGILDVLGISTATDFKSYLADQYQNGTPVTVWYVLATPETDIVNEPLMKIGDYADTISYAQAGVEIQTTKGFNTITTNTTVLPSNIEVKGVINNA